MTRPWVIWMVLVVCGLLIVGAMGWLTGRILGMEQEQAQGQAGAEVEERVRLALSRMDTAASGVLVLENQRPPEHYQAFFSPGDLYTNTFQSVTSGLVVQPSPLLSEPPEFVRLHFEVDAARRLSSPQVPTGNQRDLAEVSGVTAPELDHAAIQLEMLDALLKAPGPKRQAASSNGSNLEHVMSACAPNVTAWNDVQVDVVEERTNWMANQRELVGNQVRQQQGYQQDLSFIDQGQRAKVYENTLNKAAQSSVKRGSKGAPQQFSYVAQAKMKDEPAAPQAAPVPQGSETNQPLDADALETAQVAQVEEQADAPRADEQVKMPRAELEGTVASGGAVALGRTVVNEEAVASGEVAALDEVVADDADPMPWESVVTPFRPVWLGAELFAVRHVRTSSGSRYQGVWLDAEGLKSYLLETVADQLPNADLTKVDALVGDSLEEAYEAGAGSSGHDARALVTMPWRLEDGEQIKMVPMGWSPLRVSLGFGWVAVALAMFAAAALLSGVLKMSERRASFVSSVTHELRTPLTTFQLYSDMLAEGMVRDEDKRQEYLDTLRREAGRLNHLIENVLAYSRIERGSARTQREQLSLASLIGRIEGRLADRVAREGATIEMVGVSECEDVTIDTDVTAVEQIVFNLVDNACKYGLPDDGERLVRLYASNGGGTARIEICDNGSGITRGDERKLFRPFHKSAKDAAHSKPGVGLGLALCRRLARALGGSLTLDSSRERGACFVLELPVA